MMMEKKSKQKTLVIAKDYRTFVNFIASTCSDRKNFVYIQEPEVLWGYDPYTPLLKIEGYSTDDFPSNSHTMLRMRNQRDWRFMP